MLRNVSIDKIMEVLVAMKKEGPLVDIEINEQGNGNISFKSVRDSAAITAKTNIRVIKDPNIRLDLDDLDKLIV